MRPPAWLRRIVVLTLAAWLLTASLGVAVGASDLPCVGAGGHTIICV